MDEWEEAKEEVLLLLGAAQEISRKELNTTVAETILKVAKMLDEKLKESRKSTKKKFLKIHLC